MKPCPSCGHDLPEINRFCTQCGRALDGSPPQAALRPGTGKEKEQLNINILYGMVGLLLVALVFPPWESPPSQPAAFLGFRFILSPPQPDAIVSRMLLTIELTTTAIAGLYLSFLFRTKA
ncbi:MAG: zinc-ribbon domain-containing protein [Nitrospiraceae bacterium]|nr:zinc-ribbon domain-containing protein [Nitrospiraceae bacterium]